MPTAGYNIDWSVGIMTLLCTSYMIIDFVLHLFGFFWGMQPFVALSQGETTIVMEAIRFRTFDSKVYR